MAEPLLSALDHISPAICTYDEWCKIGMALKHEGFDCHVWTDWSALDAIRFNEGECERKWESFSDKDEIVTGGTIYHIAKTQGYTPSSSNKAFGIDETIPWQEMKKEDGIIKDGWIEGTDTVEEPKNDEWHPREEAARYLEALFKPEEYVGFVLEARQDETHNGKYYPSSAGVYTLTAGRLINDLRKKINGDVSDVLGDYNQAAGAWIRFNPLDGMGVRNNNVTSYRFALIESDKDIISIQHEILRKLELPIAALVYSGGKSLHAIVHIDAKDKREYMERVEALYKVCRENHLDIDEQNKNPSRLSRLPGVWRAGKKQFLLATNIGKPDFKAWADWYAEQNDELPNFQNLATDVDFNNLPELAPCLIDGILRIGHKCLMSGMSKAGKSFALIELTIAIAEGKPWLGWKCAQGRVLYVNLELDAASCLHRFHDVYKSMHLRPANLANIDVWNLRGKAEMMNKLAPKLIRRALKTHPIAVIIDPIYKVITGDENDAKDMADFCNQFDKIATEIGCSVIYCHHHSKGAQGGKRAMDRASGSGVFARDPDALIDLVELPLKDTQYTYLEDKAACKAIADFLDANLFQSSELGAPTWRDEVGDDDLQSPYQLTEYAKGKLDSASMARLQAAVDTAKHKASKMSGWRVSCTLREFEQPDEKDVWFDYPLHYVDDIGILKDIRPAVEVNGRVVQPRDKSDGTKKKEKRDSERQAIIDAYTMVKSYKEPDKDGVVQVTIMDIVNDSMNLFGKQYARASLHRKMKKYGDFEIDKGVVIPTGNIDSDESDDDTDEE